MPKKPLPTFAPSELLSLEQLVFKGAGFYDWQLRNLIGLYIKCLNDKTGPIGGMGGDSMLRAYLRNRICDMTGLDSEVVQTSCEAVARSIKP